MTVAQTAKAFNTLKQIHNMLGDVSSCSWAEYRSTMSAMYGIKPTILDAMARLGHFHVTDSSVRFAG